MRLFKGVEIVMERCTAGVDSLHVAVAERLE
jgi:hypothetical protein